MARSTASTAPRRFLPESLARLLRQSGIRAFGACVAGLAVAAGVALGSHASGDPSWNTVSNAQVHNLLGTPGAITADVLYQASASVRGRCASSSPPGACAG